MLPAMVGVCRGKLLTMAIFAAAFMTSIPSQGLQSAVDSAQPREMTALLAKHITDQHLAGMAAIVVRADRVVVAVAGVRKRGESSESAPATCSIWVPTRRRSRRRWLLA